MHAHVDDRHERAVGHPAARIGEVHDLAERGVVARVDRAARNSAHDAASVVVAIGERDGVDAFGQRHEEQHASSARVSLHAQAWATPRRAYRPTGHVDHVAPRRLDGARLAAVIEVARPLTAEKDFDPIALGPAVVVDFDHERATLREQGRHGRARRRRRALEQRAEGRRSIDARTARAEARLASPQRTERRAVERDARQRDPPDLLAGVVARLAVALAVALGVPFAAHRQIPSATLRKRRVLGRSPLDVRPEAPPSRRFARQDLEWRERERRRRPSPRATPRRACA